MGACLGVKIALLQLNEFEDVPVPVRMFRLDLIVFLSRCILSFKIVVENHWHRCQF